MATTDEDIRRAERALADAQAETNGPDAVDWEAVREHERLASLAAAAQGARTRRVRQAAERVAELKAQQAAEAEAAVVREAAEQAASGELDAMSAELEKSRKALVALASTAEAALLDVASAASEHDQLVQRHRTRVQELGLDEVPGVEHATFAGGGRSGLRLRGRWWHPVDPAGVVAWTVHRVAVSVFGQRHGFVQRLRAVHAACVPGSVARTRTGALLAGLPDLPVHVEPARSPVWGLLAEANARIQQSNWRGSEWQKQDIEDRQRAEARAEDSRRRERARLAAQVTTP